MTWTQHLAGRASAESKGSDLGFAPRGGGLRDARQQAAGGFASTSAAWEEAGPERGVAVTQQVSHSEVIFKLMLGSQFLYFLAVAGE